MRAFYRGGGEPLEAIRAADPPLDPWDRILTGESDGLPAPAERSPDGFTPLHIAAFAHNAAAARALLLAGADPNELATASFAQVTPLGTARPSVRTRSPSSCSTTARTRSGHPTTATRRCTRQPRTATGRS